MTNTAKRSRAGQGDTGKINENGVDWTGGKEKKSMYQLLECKLCRFP